MRITKQLTIFHEIIVGYHTNDSTVKLNDFVLEK